MENDYRGFWSSVNRWSYGATELFLEALKRDRSLCAKELSRYIGSKNFKEVRELAVGLLSTPEEVILGQPSVKSGTKKPESALDILIQTTKHISPNEFACSKVTGEVLEQYAKHLEAEEDAVSSAARGRLRYSALFHFMASLFDNRPPIKLESLEASAMLDLLTCIFHIMKQLGSDGLKNPEANANQDEGVTTDEQLAAQQQAYRSAAEKTTDFVGTYLASAAAVQLVRFQSPQSASYDAQIVQRIPVAPFFLLNGVEHPRYLKVTHALRTALFQKLSAQWNLPKLTNNDSSVDVTPSPDDPHFQQLTRLMNQFTLNPFGFPLSLMKPLQQLCNRICQPPAPHRLVDGESGVAASGLPDDVDAVSSCMRLLRPGSIPNICASLVQSEKRRCLASSNVVGAPPAKQRCIDKESATQKSTRVDQSAPVPPRATSPVHLVEGNSGAWKESKFFKRVYQSDESGINKSVINQYILVRDSLLSTPKRQSRRKK